MRLTNEQIHEQITEMMNFAKKEYEQHSYLLNERLCKGFLRNKSFKLEDAKTALKEYLELHNRMAKTPEKFMKMPTQKLKELGRDFENGFYQLDKNGNVNMFINLKDTNYDDLFLKYEVDELIDLAILKKEHFFRIILPILEKKTGNKNIKVTFIFDLKNISPFFFTTGKPYEFMSKYFSSMAKYYPDVLNSCYVINVSTFFSALFTVAKLFLHKKTVESVKILKGNFLEEMTKDIPVENIPENFGGKGVQKLHENPGPWQPFLDIGIEIGSWNIDDIEHEHSKRVNGLTAQETEKTDEKA